MHNKHHHKRCLILIVMGVLLVLAILTSFTFGRYPVPIKELLGIIGSKLGLPITPFWTAQMEAAVWNIRLPRVLMSVLVGACLATAGATYQGVFQNPIASPDVLGASAGAGFGAALAILLGCAGPMITASAFGMSLLSVALVFFISHYVKGGQILGLVLSGILIGSLFQSGTSFIKLVADPNNVLPQITYWLMGSLSGMKWSAFRFSLLPMLAGILPLMLLRWRLNILTLGDEEARTMGVHAGRVRLIAVLCSTLITAAAVSVSGLIGWVGLVIPHMMRRFIGSDYRYLLPASMLGGSIFLLIVDNISRNSTAGIPIGILTSLVGAPLFFWFITGRRRSYGNHD